MERLSKFYKELKNVKASLSGAFYPYSYAIGLPRGLSGIKLLDYPLENIESEKAIGNFIESLSFIHETVHFSQFICSSFGLELARKSNIVQNILLRGGPHKIPIMDNPFEKLDGEKLDRVFAYTFLAESLVPHVYAFKENDQGMYGKSVLYSHPISPVASLISQDGEYPGVEKVKDITRSSNQRIVSQPNIHSIDHSGNDVQVVLNTAALMECFAYLTEVAHICNALGVSREEFESEVFFFNVYEPLYTAALRYYFGVLGKITPYFVYEIASIVDLSLMYSPNIIYNVGPTHSVKNGGDKYRMPFETFANACSAAKSVRPIQSYEPREVQRFQNDICSELDIIDTVQMTQLCLDKLSELGISDESDAENYAKRVEPIDAGRMFAAHWYGLDYRNQIGEGFVVNQMKSDGIMDVMNFSKNVCTFFDLFDKIPNNLMPSRVSQNCMHYLIQDCLYKSRLECPLKFGKPFFCPSSDAEPGDLCVFVSGETAESTEILGECPLDIFEHMLVRSS